MLLSTYHLEVYSPMGQMWAWSLQWVQGQRTCRSGNCSHYGHNCGVNVKCPHELLCFRTLVSKQSLAGVTIWENCKVLGIESSLKWVARGWLWSSKNKPHFLLSYFWQLHVTRCFLFLPPCLPHLNGLYPWIVNLKNSFLIQIAFLS